MPKEDMKLSKCRAIRSANTTGSATDLADGCRAEIWDMTASTGSTAMPSSAVTSSEADSGTSAWFCEKFCTKRCDPAYSEAPNEPFTRKMAEGFSLESLGGVSGMHICISRGEWGRTFRAIETPCLARRNELWRHSRVEMALAASSISITVIAQTKDGSWPADIPVPRRKTQI